MTKELLLKYTRKQYSEYIYDKLGKGRRHAALVYSEWLKTGSVLAEDKAFINAQSLLKEIKSISDFELPLEPISEKSGDLAWKFLSKTKDGLEVESVVLPMKLGGTLCISSQVGCRMGCAFCETAKLGLFRNLTVEEIVAQVFIARFVHKFDFRNIVFMGMGEPFDNFENVKQALWVLTDSAGVAFAPRRVTVSTCGRVDEIMRFSTLEVPRVNLAISINSSSDEIRNKLMPVNKAYDMEALKKAMLHYQLQTRKEILAEYVLIDGYTETEENALELGRYLEGLNIKVNVIPYNPGSFGRFRAPSEQQIQKFAKVLVGMGYYVLVRHNKGEQIMAACGQLGNLENRKLRKQFI